MNPFNAFLAAAPLRRDQQPRRDLPVFIPPALANLVTTGRIAEYNATLRSPDAFTDQPTLNQGDQAPAAIPAETLHQHTVVKDFLRQAIMPVSAILTAGNTARERIDSLHNAVICIPDTRDLPNQATSDFVDACATHISSLIIYHLTVLDEAQQTFIGRLMVNHFQATRAAIVAPELILFTGTTLSRVFVAHFEVKAWLFQTMQGSTR